MVEPAAVLQRRLARGQQQVLVRWKGAPAAESAWVDVEDFKAQFPEFQLGDELLLQGGRDVMYHTYYSRPNRRMH
jgi:hypothetical protein